MIVLLLIALAFRDFPSTIAEQLERCPAVLYEPSGLMKWFAPSGADAKSWGAFSSARFPLVGFLLGAGAVGLGGRVPFFIGVGLLTMIWGASRGCVGTGHAWYLPVYALLVLSCTPPDRWSIDAWIAKKWPRYIFAPPPELESATKRSLARKLVALLAVYVLFSAGVSKLIESGIQWGDGTSLHAYLTTLGAPKPWARGLHEYLTADPERCRIPALATLALELSAPLVLFFPKTRWPFFVAASGFHLVIWGLMLPEFFGQIVCYGLLVDWRRGRTLPKKAKPTPYGLGAWVPASLLVVLCGSIALRVDAFPITDVPMYATRTGGSYLAGYPRDEWGKLASAQEIARTFVKTRRPWLAGYLFARRVKLLARVAGQSRPVDLTERAHLQLAPANAALWEARLSSIVALDLAALPSASGAPGPQKDGESAKLLRAVAKELDLAKTRQVQALALVYLLDGAPPVPLAVVNAAEFR